MKRERETDGEAQKKLEREAQIQKRVYEDYLENNDVNKSNIVDLLTVFTTRLLGKTNKKERCLKK